MTARSTQNGKPIEYDEKSKKWVYSDKQPINKVNSELALEILNLPAYNEDIMVLRQKAINYLGLYFGKSDTSQKGESNE